MVHDNPVQMSYVWKLLVDDYKEMQRNKTANINQNLYSKIGKNRDASEKDEPSKVKLSKSCRLMMLQILLTRVPFCMPEHATQ